MHLKRFYGASVIEALAQARQQLGPDALVLSTRLVPARGVVGWLGRRRVEMTAAVTREVSASRPQAQGNRQPDGQGSLAPSEEPMAVVPSREGPGSRTTGEQVGPRAFDHSVERAVARASAPDARTAIVKRFLDAGLEPIVAHEAAALVPTSRRSLGVGHFQRALATLFTDLCAGEEPFASIEVFIGSPGAGKTTTIAKIAAQQRMRSGEPLGLIAADAYRVGAAEQLRLYAGIVGSPFSFVRTAADLEQAIGTMRLPVLLDTAGRSPGEPMAREIFVALSGLPGVRTHLVLAAGTRACDAERIFDRYRGGQPDRVILTKLDETDSLAPLMGVLRERKVPISYLATGQRVPEDLHRATPALLASSVVTDAPDAMEVPA